MTTAYSCRIEVRSNGTWVPAPGDCNGWGVVEALDIARVGAPAVNGGDFAPQDVRVVQEETGLVVEDGYYDALPSICKRAIIAIGGDEFDATDAVFCIEALGNVSLGVRRNLARHLFMSAATRAKVAMDPITLNLSHNTMSARCVAWNAACDEMLLPLGEQD